MKQWTGGIVALCLLATGAMAGNAHVQVRDAWTRAVPAVAPVAGGFLTVVNDGDVDDRLLRVESDVAQRVDCCGGSRPMSRCACHRMCRKPSARTA